jgi:hypothetical protein
MNRRPARVVFTLLIAAGSLTGAAVPAIAAPPSAPAPSARVDDRGVPPVGSAAEARRGLVDETQHNEAALRAITKHWGDAERDGDVGYLEQLLAPEYRSIDAKGSSHLRSMILEHARKNHGSAEARKAVEAWLLTHPTETAVTIHGDLAVLSYFNPKRGVDAGIRGSDIFLYEAGRWHAIFSMHNNAE